MKRTVFLWMCLLIFPLGALAQEVKPLIVLNAFTVAADSALPYDMKLLQTSTVAELKARFIKEFVDFAAESSGKASGKTYKVDGVFSNWKGGSTAKRILVGFGSGRESVDLHFWITDEAGKKLVDRKEKIKAQFLGSAYQGNVGELVHPLPTSWETS
jgi:hypothetical protein